MCIRDRIYLDFTLQEPTEVLISLYDVNGKVLLERPVEFISQKELEIDISTFANGLYFVKIQAEEKVAMKRFILQANN